MSHEIHSGRQGRNAQLLRRGMCVALFPKYRASLRIRVMVDYLSVEVPDIELNGRCYSYVGAYSVGPQQGYRIDRGHGGNVLYSLTERGPVQLPRRVRLRFMKDVRERVTAWARSHPESLADAISEDELLREAVDAMSASFDSHA